MRKSVISTTIKSGQVIPTPHITFYRRPPSNDNDRLPKPVIIVSKKINLSAVVRHKYQRWIRELMKQIPNLPPHNYVLIAKPTINQVTSLSQLIDSIEPKLEELLNSKNQ